MRSLKYLAATSLFAASMHAGAGLIISGGTVESISGKGNDFETDIGATQYNIGGNLLFDASADPRVNLTFTFLGKEAGWNTIFSAYGASSLSNNSTVGDSFTVHNVDTTDNGGLLNFNFEVVGPEAPVGDRGSIANGLNVFPEPNGKSFALVLNTDFTTTLGTVNYDALAMWDDAGGGSGDDDNHDDQVIGLTISKVPEPGTIALLGLGLVGLGLSRRRNK